MISENYILFFTATVMRWKRLLQPDKYKKIIVDSLQFLVEQNKINLYGFVIMPNHIHILWSMKSPYMLQDVKRDFLKYTSQTIKYDLQKYHPKVLAFFKSNRKDREYQFWQDRSFNTPIYNRKVLEQKLDYIHNNPISKKWNLVDRPEKYKYSSAKYYIEGDTEFNFITHYTEHI